MKEPSLQKTTALSLALHISVLFIALLLLRQSSQYLLPSYTVNLVGPEVLRGKESLKSTPGRPETLRGTSVTEGVPKEVVKKRVKEEELLEEKISAIEAKKRVERIVRLRSIISLQGSISKKEISETPSAHTGKGSLFDDYYTKIKNEIWQQWVYPGTGQKELETIISIRIMKDGTISLQRIEKSSGNPLFDKSAIKALTKANPLSPPPYEMEIGVRFYP
jgi:colicin import membrane protein